MRYFSKRSNKVLAVILCICMCASLCSVTSLAQTKPAVTDSTSAYYNLKQAWEQNKDTPYELDWSEYSWKAEYTNANLGGFFQPMVYVSEVSDGADSSFGYKDLFGAQPCLFGKDNGVILLANQWGDDYWYDIAAVSFTCQRDGKYLLTCPIIRAGYSDSLTDGHEGRLSLTKNGKRIWPLDKAFASVTQENSPEFEEMVLELKKGDIIRFQGYGGIIGNGGTYNNSYWQNHIYLTPAIQPVYTSVEESEDNSLFSSAAQNLIFGELPLISYYRMNEQSDATDYSWSDMNHLTDEDVDTSSQSSFLSQSEFDYQTLTYEISEEATVQQIQLIFESSPRLSLFQYELYLSDDYDNLYSLENMIGMYKANDASLKNHLFTLNTPMKGDFLGLKITGAIGQSVSLSEFSVLGQQIGDLDRDHQVAATDVVVLRKDLVTDKTFYPAADINGDGKLNIKDVIRMKKDLIERDTAVNPEVNIPEKPQKEWVLPETEHPYGAAAPEWLRNAEMFCEASQQQMFATGGYSNWAPYFDLCIGAWSQDVDILNANGPKAGSYFDPYHVYNNEEIAIIDKNGVGVQSDYASDRGDPLYLICQNSDKGMDYMRAYVENCLGFGAKGMFYDDTRMPYIPLRENAQTCYSTQHNHVVEGDISTNYINRTIRSLYRLVKERDKDFFVVLNGGTPIPHNQTAEYETENIWKHCDAIMWENFLYDSLTTRWVKPDLLKSAGTRLYDGVQQGKTALLLSYSFHNMTAERATAAALDTIAYCRLYDVMWSDYASLYASSVPKSTVRRLYNIKTGPAGSLGTYYGRVVDRDSGAPISGVNVSCGSVSTVTDANGNYRITMPVNEYTVTLKKNGYTTTTGKVSGTSKDFTMAKADGTVYYVSPNGSNYNNGKTKSSAFRSLNYAEASGLLQPGDTVVVCEGTYELPNQTLYSTSGTAEQPITYYADGDVTLRFKKGVGTGLILAGDYTSFDGFALEGSVTGVGGLVRVEGRGVEMKNCTFRDTAYYTVGNIRPIEAAVMLNGQDAFFHHNVLGQNLYGKSALVVGANGVKVYNNTFDGAIIGKNRVETAVSLGEGVQGFELKNNLFVDFEAVFDTVSNQEYSATHNLCSKVSNTTGLSEENANSTTQDLMFMYRPNGDYALKKASAAVNSGADLGFAYRGEMPDIGAKESKYWNEGYDPVSRSNGVTFRVFADTVVVMNPETSNKQVGIVLGRAGVKLYDAITDKVYMSDASGNLFVNIAAETSLILQAR